MYLRSARTARAGVALLIMIVSVYRVTTPYSGIRETVSLRRLPMCRNRDKVRIKLIK